MLKQRDANRHLRLLPAKPPIAWNQTLEHNKNFARDWFVFQRIQDVKSASRINLLRIVAILVFYGIVLTRYITNDAPEADSVFTDYMWSSTRICGAWLFASVFVWIALYLRAFPPIVKYVTTFCDVILLTAIISVGTKAESNLIVIYFLLVAATFMRYSVPLVLFTTACSIFGYLTLVYNTPHFWDRPEGVDFPYVEMARVVAGLCMMALIGWQLIRGCRHGLQISIESNLTEAAQK